MSQAHCGIDFGTSNSSASVFANGRSTLVPVDGTERTVPSSIFFPFEHTGFVIGRQGIADYVDQEPGRLMRGLKSILGSPLIGETARIGHRTYTYREIVGLILSHLKTSLEQTIEQDVTRVVLGRPVHFVGSAPDTDVKAVRELEQIAQSVGFQDVAFQLEPIAAALQYEQTATREGLALIADIGGGTTDFSIVRTTPKSRDPLQRKQDVLANGGLRLGGTDLDRELNLETAMRKFGHRELVRADWGNEMREAPPSLFHDLATWHRILFTYTEKSQTLAKDMRRLAKDKKPFDRLLQLLNGRSAHQLAHEVESTKIALSDTNQSTISLDFIEDDLVVPVHLTQFSEAIRHQLDEIQRGLMATLSDAGVTAEQIDVAFLTGGTCQVPSVRNAVVELLPTSQIEQGDMLGSVGLGLGIDAARRFS